MKKIFNKIILSCSILLVVSCVELDEKPQDFVGPDNFYNTPEQIQTAFNASMTKLYGRWYSYGYGIRRTFRNDDIYRGGDLNFSSGTGNDIWGSHYAALADINPAIGAIKAGKLGIEYSQETKDALEGYAKFLRAYNYFTLVRFYGDLPLITEDVNAALDEVSRTPIAEVYDFIVNDLKFAAEHLPATPEKPGRPTSGAANALLAKVYLTMASYPLKDESKWAAARDAAKAVIDGGNNSLISDVEKVFALENAHGPENMFNFEANIDRTSTPPQIWLPGRMTGWGDFTVEPEFFEGYPEQPRKKAYLLTEDWQGVSYDEWDTPNRYARKFVYNDEESIRRLTSTQGVPIIRYADVLLIYAEAANMANNGPTQEAVDALNMVIDRANGGVENTNHPRVTLSMSKDAFDAAVINERALELFFEFDRWHDLVRKEILCQEIQEAYQPNCTPQDYLLPIPGSDLSETIPQNPGY